MPKKNLMWRPTHRTFLLVLCILGTSAMSVIATHRGLLVGQVSDSCGNGILEPSEACDDGNKVDGDGCSKRCRNEETVTCTDSDEGMNTEVQGFVHGEVNGSNQVWLDFCSEIIGEGRTLVEYTCTDEGEVQSNVIECPQSCNSGRCIGGGTSEEKVEKREEEKDEEQASSTSAARIEPKQNGCNDSDGGDAPTKKGTTSTMKNGTAVSSWTDLCSGLRLAEYVCAGDSVQSTLYICERGCIDGACVPDEETSTTPTETPNTSEEAPQRPSAPVDTGILVPKVFPDVDPASLEGIATAELYKRGVLAGLSNGTFGGGLPVTRAEAVKLLLLARYGYVPSLQTDGRFKDVLDGEWHSKYIAYAVAQEIVEGYPDGYFRPVNEVNTAEFLKMLAHTFELELDMRYAYLDVSPTYWYGIYAGIAQEYDLLPGRPKNMLKPAEFMTRKEVVVALYQLLQALPEEVLSLP